MTVELAVQDAAGGEVPGEAEFLTWVTAALDGRRAEAELTIRLVDREESRALNARYRDRDRPTNVLSFPAEVPPEVGSALLGDLVICAELVAEEAAAQGKEARAHWAHLTVHGLLHLLGYDHEQQAEAVAMETLEIGILAGLGFPDPYRGAEHDGA